MSKVWIFAVGLVLVLDAALAAPRKSPRAAPQVLSGTVSRVIDGDTLWLKTDAASGPVVVRIEGVDAPESCQVGGAEATAALTEQVLGRVVTVRVAAIDAYDRSVGKVLDGERDVGDRLVRDGHAWSTRYRFDRGPYVASERMAKALKRGLHAQGDATQPRDFRSQHGPCETSTPAAH